MPFFQVVSAQESGNAAVAAAVSVAAGLPTSSPSMYCSSMNSAEAMGKMKINFVLIRPDIYI